MKKQNKQNGITLVALVITIIILLILAGISISALTNQGIFAQVQEAKKRTENAQKQESEMLENYLAQINAITFKNVDKSETDPEAAMPKGAVVIEGDANKGIVIKDSKDNEWVWVEVPKTTVFTSATKADDYENIKTDLISYAIDYREGADGQGLNWTDEWYAMDEETLVTASTTGLTDDQKALSNGCGLTYTQYQEVYQKMLSSVYTNGGFWISRYEIGDSTATANNYAVRTSGSGTTGVAVSKANQIPYNFITCSEAQGLASGMSADTSKTSSLLFGIQWDLVCKFLEERGNLSITEIKSGDDVGSTIWGNYKNSSLTLNRGKYLVKGSSSNIWIAFNVKTDNYVTDSQTSNDENYYQLLTTGASEQTNKMNIYDFAGNEWEWTLEKTSVTGYPCAYRGGSYGNCGSDYPASSRYYHITTSSSVGIGFRSTLY